MAEHSGIQKESGGIKSLDSDVFSLVTFVNKSQRKVDIYWINFSGERVKYETLKPGETWPVTTFVSHPWIVRDADTGDIMCVDNEDIFYPKAWDYEHQQWNVNITLAVYPLRERCLQVVRKLVPNADKIKKLDVPPVIKRDLLFREDVLCHTMMPVNFYVD